MVKVKEDMTGWNMWEHGVPDSRLTVIKQVEDYIRQNGSRTAQWLCECNCEKHTRFNVRSDALRDGSVKSCGCLSIEYAKINCSLIGKQNHKTNKYDISGQYGVGWTSNTNKEFYFDLEDYDLIKKYCWTESKNKHGYVRLTAKDITTDNLKYKKISMMELLGFKKHDHKDRNPLNNQKSNFRIATNCQQGMNRNKFKNNTSGYIGVGWRKREKKWCAYIQINKKTTSLGYYDNKEDAIIARLKAEAQYYGEFAPQIHLFKQYKIN